MKVMAARLGRISKSTLLVLSCIFAWCLLAFRNEIFSSMIPLINQYDVFFQIQTTSTTPTKVHADFNHSEKEVLPKCGMGKSFVGPLFVDKSAISWEVLRKELNTVNKGGKWLPTDCIPIAKTAIVIPYRDREEHLKVFLRQIHPILQRQQLNYQIFVIEQADKSKFNRGKLMNVGYKEAIGYGDFNCFVFHDVDLIPEDDRNYYGCNKSPMHMSVAVDKHHYRLMYLMLFGGIEMFTRSHFELINGFSNIFWGWGAEDDNLYQRISRHHLPLQRPPSEKARYQMLGHDDAQRSDKRYKIEKVSTKYLGEDGLNSLNYEKVDTIQHSLYTKISVDLKEAEDTIKVPWNETEEAIKH